MAHLGHDLEAEPLVERAGIFHILDRHDEVIE
jgi:hypothetical protein